MRTPEISQELQGVGIGDGTAYGRLHLLTGAVREVQRSAVGSVEEERARFCAAQRRAQSALRTLYTEARAEVGEEAAQIFAVHAMIAEDEDFTDLVHAGIGEGESAEEAVIEAAEELSARFRAMDDDYLRARAADFGDIAARLCDILGGEPERGRELPDWGEPIILAAHDLTPSETVGLDRTRIAGFVTGGGSPGSHTAILARSMGIPALVGVGLLDVTLEGRAVLLDARTGRLMIDPDDEQMAEYRARKEAERRAEHEREALISLPAVTRSGRTVQLCANIGLPVEAERAAALGADGVGLMRSEFLYLGRAEPPGEEEQYTAYLTAARALGERPLVIRTLDIGADKQVDYLDLPREDNPALGLRAIRLCFVRRELFRTQLRAICRAAAERPGQIALMFPMIGSTWEFDEAMHEFDAVQAALRAEGVATDAEISVGMMVETPSAAILADHFAERADFFSIGSNDLTQYTLAADRQNAAVAHLAEGAHPAVLKLIERAAAAIHRTGGWCGICGELAADPSLTETLIRLGADELSVSATQLLRIKESIRNCP